MKHSTTKLLILIGIVLTPFFTQAGTVCRFLNNDIETIFMSGLKANQSIWFHALPTGGERLVTCFADVNGSYKFACGSKVPAFALVEEKHHYPVGDIEFKIGLSMEKKKMKEKRILVNLENRSDVEFILMKSIDGVSFKEERNLGESFDGVIELTSAKVDMFYKIEVRSRSKGLRYSSLTYFVEHIYEIRVFPTVTSGDLNLDYGAIRNKDILLNIYDTRGNLMSTQKLENQHYISISNLRYGMYILNFVGPNINTSCRVLKLN